MADDYTPTTEQVRQRYIDHRYGYGADFDRWMAAHDAQKRAEWEAEQGEAEWEYGIRSEPSGNVISVGAPWMDHQFAAKVTANDSGNYGVRRRKAGPWLPVDETPNRSDGSAER